MAFWWPWLVFLGFLDSVIRFFVKRGVIFFTLSPADPVDLNNPVDLVDVVDAMEP